MKTRILSLLTLFLAIALHAVAEDIVVSGYVKNKSNKKIIPGATVYIPGTNIGTATNADGFFTLKFPDSLSTRGIKAQSMGYRKSTDTDGVITPGNNFRITIWLEPVGKVLNEVTVYGADPQRLIVDAIDKIQENYSRESAVFTSFYRETVRKGKRYISVSEAVADVFKTPYTFADIYGEKVKIKKGRKLVSPDRKDTLAVKLSGGPLIPIMLDIVKNRDYILSPEDIELYDLKMEPMTSIDNREQFVVSFRPKHDTEKLMHKGVFYIDAETHAFTRAEFSVDMNDKDKVTNCLLSKKPRGLRFTPDEMSFTVSYRYQDGVSYLNYISSKSRFKCDWKKRLFSSGYTVEAEMVMVDMEKNRSWKKDSGEMFYGHHVFSDKVSSFLDPDFWRDYNIIEPTESLEKAVSRLKAK